MNNANANITYKIRKRIAPRTGFLPNTHKYQKEDKSKATIV